MTSSVVERPPYRVAALVFAAILAGYVFTLAPTVTLWDAGELIAASKTLGIPHPPGTPLFVLMAHVWASLVPIGEFAWRTNLLSAGFSAAGSALWFLSAHVILTRVDGVAGPRPGSRNLFTLAGAAGAACISAFTYTQWQNSNETEVYAVATFTIAAVVWLALRWRAQRGTPAATKCLLLAIYLGGLSIGNHLLALLVGPGLVAFLVAELIRHPAGESSQRRAEWGQAAVVAGVWALLIGVGLGSTVLVTLGATAFGAALVVALRRGAGGFAGLTLVLAAIGVSTYLFMFIRAGQHPMINEADPATWDALLDVIRRSQYPLRTPFDNPTELHGPENSGRNLTLIGLQLLNYAQYFGWQWVRGIPGQAPLSVGGLLSILASLAAVSLGIRGMVVHRRADRSGWWLFLGVFLVTGLGLVAYMNFKPGYSLAHDLFPARTDHEVRERDYFFVVSFIVWAIWVGIGLFTVARRLVEKGLHRAVGVGVLSLAVIPFALNFRSASRRHAPAPRLAADFAYNLLNSVGPYGVVFTYGDNDTFPLWWAQEVEGIRQDVTVVCLALAETPWYMRQLRDNPTRLFDEAAAPEVWQGLGVPRPDWPLHQMTDLEIDAAVPQYLQAEARLRLGGREVILPANTLLMGKDFVSIRLLQHNLGRRPIAWALTAVGTSYGLDDLLVQEGLVLRVASGPADSTDMRYDFGNLMGAPIDIPMTSRLLFETYRFGELLDGGVERLEPFGQSLASTLGLPFAQLGFAAQSRGDLQEALRLLGLAARLSVNQAVRDAFRQAQEQLPTR